MSHRVAPAAGPAAPLWSRNLTPRSVMPWPHPSQRLVPTRNTSTHSSSSLPHPPCPASSPFHHPETLPPPRRNVSAACAAPLSSPPCPAPSASVRLRQVRPDDVAAAAALCLDAFGGSADGSGAPFRTLEQWERQLAAAISGKAAAAREARIDRLISSSSELQAQLAALEPVPRRRSRLPDTRSPEGKAAITNRWRRRLFYCCVAEETDSDSDGSGGGDGSDGIVGCVALTLARPEAAFPPPFPTTAKIRCYVSNMAVTPGRRRQGVASALLARAERVAALWGQESVWLHVEADNIAAVGLYRGAGYREMPWVAGVAPWRGTRRLLLMTKDVPRLRVGRGRERQREDAEAVGGARGQDGVFVWKVEDGGEGGGGESGGGDGGGG